MNTMSKPSYQVISSKTKWHDHMKKMARERAILNEKEEESVKRNLTSGRDCRKIQTET